MLARVSRIVAPVGGVSWAALCSGAVKALVDRGPRPPSIPAFQHQHRDFYTPGYLIEDMVGLGKTLIVSRDLEMRAAVYG